MFWRHNWLLYRWRLDILHWLRFYLGLCWRLRWWLCLFVHPRLLYCLLNLWYFLFFFFWCSGTRFRSTNIRFWHIRTCLIWSCILLSKSWIYHWVILPSIFNSYISNLFYYVFVFVFVDVVVAKLVLIMLFSLHLLLNPFLLCQLFFKVIFFFLLDLFFPLLLKLFQFFLLFFGFEFFFSGDYLFADIFQHMLLFIHHFDIIPASFTLFCLAAAQLIMIFPVHVNYCLFTPLALLRLHLTSILMVSVFKTGCRKSAVGADNRFVSFLFVVCFFSFRHTHPTILTFIILPWTPDVVHFEFVDVNHVVACWTLFSFNGFFH